MRSADTHRIRALFCVSMAVLIATSGCTRPRQTTAVGSGIGGALGAGLGAIVGNQTGNAGSGLAIGAAAGAATGAIIGNALQAQDEKTTAQNETLKRQEKQLQAQRNEIAELRSMNSDSGYAATPRYRYRQPSIDSSSPEVERQMARLQQRGPNPRNPGVAAYRESTYKPTTVTTPTKKENQSLARYDVRSQMQAEKSVEKPKTQPAATTTDTEPKTVAAVQLSKERLPDPEPETKQATEKEVIPETSPESDTESTGKKVVPATNSAECKEALNEKELALASAENSDKLFHLRRALRLCPTNAAFHYELGNTYAAMERTSNAEEEYKQALSIDPSMAAAKNALADLLKNETKF